MNLSFYMEKLKSSKIFKRFVEENPGAYFCSGFFTIDKEGKDNQRHIDFYSPEKKQIFSFNLNSEEEIAILPAEENEDLKNTLPVPEKLSENIDFEFEEVESMIEKEIEKRDLKTKTQKIIISLQNFENKTMLICTVFIKMLGLLKVQIDLDVKEGPKIILFEKKSFFDFLKRAK